MLVIVGGHTRNIGKTTVVCEVIRATPEANWCAIKITQHGHGICADDGDDCGCAPEDPTHPYAIDEQHVADSTDSGRYLSAGAVKSYWLRTPMGGLGHALPALKQLLAQHDHVIVESNSLLQFLTPDLYVQVMNFEKGDIKDSARLFMDRAEAFVVTSTAQCAPAWDTIPEKWFAGKNVYRDGDWSGLFDLVRTKLEPIVLHITTPEAWTAARASGAYQTPDLDRIGFIHFCRVSQLEFVLNKYFSGQTQLAVLRVATARLQAPLRFEKSEPALDPFPHLYGALNIDAVVAVESHNPPTAGTCRG